MTADELLSRRFAALGCGDFAVVYDTYAEDSPFIQQFSDCVSYVHFAQQQLGSINVRSWKSLSQRHLEGNQQEHLLVMELTVDGVSQYFYELALLVGTAAGWRYHSAQKLSSEDYSGPPEQIRFSHFDQVQQKIRY